MKLGAGLALTSWGLVNATVGLSAIAAFTSGLALVFVFGF